MTGMPGEGDAEFDELLSFLRESRIERVGVFPFSPEDGTPAARMPHCDAEEAARRAELVLELQGRILDEFAEAQVGRKLDVLIESRSEAGDAWIGRSWADSPEIDSFVEVIGEAKPGEIVQVSVDRAENGVLYGSVERC